MENINFKANNIESINPNELEVGKTYKISAPYTRGKYEGQTFDGEVEFLGTESDANSSPMYKFLYTKHPEHHEEVGGGSTYVTNSEGLQWIKELN